MLHLRRGVILTIRLHCAEGPGKDQIVGVDSLVARRRGPRGEGQCHGINGPVCDSRSVARPREGEGVCRVVSRALNTHVSLATEDELAVGEVTLVVVPDWGERPHREDPCVYSPNREQRSDDRHQHAAWGHRPRGDDERFAQEE